MANNISVLDSDGTARTVKTTESSEVHTPHHISEQSTHDNLNANANLQVGDADVGAANPVPVQAAGVSVTVKRAAVNLSASGNLVAAVASNKVKVLGLFLMADADLTVTIEDGSGGTDLIPAVPFAADGNGFVLPVAPVGSHWIETGVNTALYATITGTGNLTGVVVYHEEA